MKLREQGQGGEGLCGFGPKKLFRVSPSAEIFFLLEESRRSKSSVEAFLSNIGMSLGNSREAT